MENNDKNDITLERIRQLMGGISQEAFAEKIGFSQASIHRVLSKGSPSLAMLTAIATTYHVSVDWLLGLSDAKEIRSGTATMTYYEAMQALHKLLFDGHIFFDPDYSSYSDHLWVNDRILAALLAKYKNVKETNKDTTEYWLASLAEDFNLPLVDFDTLTYNFQSTFNENNNDLAATLRSLIDNTEAQ